MPPPYAWTHTHTNTPITPPRMLLCFVPVVPIAAGAVRQADAVDAVSMVSGCGEAFPLKGVSEVTVALGAHDLYPPPIRIRLG